MLVQFQMTPDLSPVHTRKKEEEEEDDEMKWKD